MNEKNKKEEFRRGRLKDFVEREGGHAEFVQRYNLTQSQASYLSQIVNGYAFGEKSAENWRRKLRLPVGYFDAAQETGDEDRQDKAVTFEQKRMLQVMGRLDLESQAALLRIASLLPADEKKIGGRRIGGERRQRENAVKAERRQITLTKKEGSSG